METGETPTVAGRKSRRVRLAVAAALVASTVPVVVATTATSAQASEYHYVRVDTAASPRAWTAWGWLLNPSGQQIYAWKEVHSSGSGYVKWGWTWTGDSSWLRVKIDGATTDIDKSHMALDRNHCFGVSLGVAYYRGANIC